MKNLFFVLALLLGLSACNLLNTQKTTTPSQQQPVGSQSASPEAQTRPTENMTSDALSDVSTDTLPTGASPNNTQTEASDIGTIQQDIETAFKSKYPDWDMDTLEIKISKVEGDFVSGGIGPVGGGPGGGYFFAAKNQSAEWVIAADGNGAIMCDDIQTYNFPTDMIPVCYDPDLGQEVTR